MFRGFCFEVYLNECLLFKLVYEKLFICDLFSSCVLLFNNCVVIIWSNWVDYVEFCINNVSFILFICNL